MKKSDLAWIASFIYIAYLFIGQLPILKNDAIFSSLTVSILLVIVYAISSVLIIGGKRSVYFFMIAAVVGSLLELLSLNTGIPFGKYVYTGELGPKIGQLPIFIPLLWASLSFYSYRAGGKLLMPILMVAIDLSFDPRYSGHLWIWISKTQYFGDPWSNFVGWFITAAIIIGLYSVISRGRDDIDMRAVIFFILFGIDNCISDIYDKLFIPAYISLSIFLVLGVLLTLTSIKKLHPENNGLKD